MAPEAADLRDKVRWEVEEHEVLTVQRSESTYALLSTNVPHSEGNILISDSLNVEA